MKTKYMVALAIVGSFALGVAAVHGLHAKTASFMRAQPDNRIVLFHFENMDMAQAWWDSPGRKNSQPIGDKYATFRIFAVEGISP